VLSVGGGTPCYSNNIDIIKSKTKNTFYLKVPIEKLSKRLFSRKEKRPIISHVKSVEEMNNFLAKHLFERYPFYEKSNYVIDSNRNDTIEVVNKIISTLNNNCL
jgi:shikimate kinase